MIDSKEPKKQWGRKQPVTRRALALLIIKVSDFWSLDEGITFEVLDSFFSLN